MISVDILLTFIYSIGTCFCCYKIYKYIDEDNGFDFEENYFYNY
jgi:hypothetical protein